MNLYVRMNRYRRASPVLAFKPGKPPLLDLYRVDEISEYFLKDTCVIVRSELFKNACLALVPDRKLAQAIQALNGKRFKRRCKSGIVTFVLWAVPSHSANKSSDDWKAPKNVGWKRNMVYEIGRRLNGEGWWMPSWGFNPRR
jgi:hypothetical protein